MPEKTAGKEKIIKTTGELFRRQGYHATGLNQIIAESGVPKGSLYFHFPGGKEEIARASLAAAGEYWLAALTEAAGDDTDPAEAIVRACDRLADELENSGYGNGCPIATVALEQSTRSEGIRTVCSDHYHEWQEIIAERLEKHGVPDPGDTALFVLSTIEGALLLARTHHDVTPLKKVAARLAAMFPAV